MEATLQPALYQPATPTDDGGAMALTLPMDLARKLHAATGVWNRRTGSEDTPEQFLALVLDAKLKLWADLEV